MLTLRLPRFGKKCQGGCGFCISIFLCDNTADDHRLSVGLLESFFSRYALRLPRTPPPPAALCGCNDGLADLCDADVDADEASEDGFLTPAVDAKLDSMLEN